MIGIHAENLLRITKLEFDVVLADGNRQKEQKEKYILKRR